MRDDVRALADGLARHCRTRLELVQKLLASESEKLHYEQTGNLERVMGLTRDDGSIIDAIMLADYDIGHAEDALCAVIGVGRSGLYDTLGAEAREIMELKERAERDIGELRRMRCELARKLEDDARDIRASIQALSRIDALKGADSDDSPL